MRSQHSGQLDIDAALLQRLDALARRDGTTLADLTDDVLRRYVESTERSLRESAEDDARWQRYQESGTVVSADAVRARLSLMTASVTGQRRK